MPVLSGAGERRLERRFDRPRRFHRILGAADRPSNDKNAGAIIPRLSRRDDALLIADRAARRAQTGDDEEAVLPLLMNLADLFARADDAVEPGRVRECGQSHDLVGVTDAYSAWYPVTLGGSS